MTIDTNSLPLEIAFAVFLGAGVVLFYAHIVYPSIMALAGWILWKETSFSETPLPHVTLLIAAYNEEDVIAAKVHNARTLDYPADKLEIIVVSDGSTDETLGAAHRAAKGSNNVSIYANQQNIGKAATLNSYIPLSKGAVVCLCDANVMFAPDSLRRLVRHFCDPAIGAVSGDVQLTSHEVDFGEGESQYYQIERAIHLGESTFGCMMGVDGGMYALRREAFRQIPSDTLNDDLVISMNAIRKGYRVIYDPTAIARENATPTALEEWRRRIRVSAGIAQILLRRQWPPVTRPVELWQFISHKLLRWLTPFWLIALLLANACLWSQGVIYQITLVAQILFYLVAALAAVSIHVRRTRIGGVAFYFTMSQIAMAVGILKGLFRKQSGRWKRTARTALPEVPTT